MKVVQLLSVTGEVLDEIEVAPDVAQVTIKIMPTLAAVPEPEPEPEPEPTPKRVTRVERPKPKPQAKRR